MDTGMVRKVDDLGRLVIPAETRKLFHIHEGDQLAISVEGDRIILQKQDASCTFCGSTKEVTRYKGKGLCASCAGEIRSS